MEYENKKDCNCDHIEGIKCDVKNCLYHEVGCRCTAGQIEVGPSDADSSSDTVCATFRPKDIG